MNRIVEKNNKKGFTLAELMIAVAIIAILAGVAFIGVARYMRTMARLERDGLAKELYYAAQNNLTMAEGQGFLGVKYKEDPGGVDSYVVRAGDVNGIKFDSDQMLGHMLPFGSVDETIRGGNYYIRYQLKPARVLDVVYCPSGNANYLYSFGENDDQNAGIKSDLASICGKDKAGDRLNHDGAVLGWYGDAVASDGEPTKIENPEITLVNDDALFVDVENKSDSAATVRLIVEGVTSKEQGYYNLTFNDGKTTARFVLDDITDPDLCFSQLKTRLTPAGARFIPGENIRVYAIAFNNSDAYTVGRSAVKTTNSLFADLKEKDSGLATEVSIGSMRHLANLYNNNSSMFFIDGTFNAGAVVARSTEVRAVQIKDLDWNGFLESTDISGKSLYKNGTKQSEGIWLPVDPSYALKYDGNNHKIANVKVVSDADAGLFSELAGTKLSRAENMALVNFDITSSGGNAGALAGKATSSKIVNVVAYNDSGYTASNNINTTGSSKSAGGLVGTVSSSEVRVSAAALFVTSSGNAGGLIGTIGTADNRSTIMGCYSGGHLDSDKDAIPVTYKAGFDNVTGTTAGGLIGDANGAEIGYSYSTCSVKGATAGGFVGTASGNMTKCYATGLVEGSNTSATKGAFAGSYSGTGLSGCSYYEIINEIKGNDGNYSFLAARGNSSDDISGLTAFDHDVTSYNSFVSADTSWTKAEPYNNVLKSYYKKEGEAKYNLPNIRRLAPEVSLGGSVDKISALADYDKTEHENKEDDPTKYLAETHYGDWPAPEIFVINTN